MLFFKEYFPRSTKGQGLSRQGLYFLISTDFLITYFADKTRTNVQQAYKLGATSFFKNIFQRHLGNKREFLRFFKVSKTWNFWEYFPRTIGSHNKGFMENFCQGLKPGFYIEYTKLILFVLFFGTFFQRHRLISNSPHKMRL